MPSRLAVLLSTLLLLSVLTTAQDTPTRLLRYPAISKELIAFVYAVDIWLAPIAGGTASSAGVEELLTELARHPEFLTSCIWHPAL